MSDFTDDLLANPDPIDPEDCPNGLLNRVRNVVDGLRAENAELREALERIALHEFNSYEAAKGPMYEGSYGVGVVDGHRLCASIARAVLGKS